MHNRRQRAILVVSAVLFALLGLGPAIVEGLDLGYLVPTLSRIAIFGLAVMSLDLVVGYGGMVSVGHAAFFGIGGYTAGALSFHLIDGSTFVGIPGTDQMLVVWPVALLVGALLGLVIGSLSLRTRGVYFIMATLAFNQMLFFVFNSLEVYGGDDGVALFAADRRLGPIDVGDDTAFFYVCFGVLAVAFVLLNLVVRSPFGRVVRGCHDNEARMAALGYSTYRYRLVAFSLSASLTSLAGALAVAESQFLSPDMARWTVSGEFLVMGIAGGLGSLVGGVIGAGALLLLEELAIDYTDNWEFFVGIALLVIVLVARRGIAGFVLKGEQNA